MKWITPFAYIDEDGMCHFCADKVLEFTGLPITDENLRIATLALAESAREMFPDTEVRVKTSEGPMGPVMDLSAWLASQQNAN